jgi:hypothetical protein
LDELIELWKREKLTTEQIIGQLLQILKEHERRVREIARGQPPANAGKRDRGA